MGKDRSDSILVLRKVLWGMQCTIRPRAPPPHMWLTICLLVPCEEVEIGLALHWGGYRELLVSLSKLARSGYPKKFNRQVA